MEINFMWKDHPGAARHPSKEGNLGYTALIPLLGGVPSADGGVVILCYPVAIDLWLSVAAVALALTVPLCCVAFWRWRCATGWHVAHAATGSYFWRNKSNQNSHGGGPP